MSDEIQIAIFGDVTEAEIAKSLLTSNGVPCILAHDNAGAMHPQLDLANGIRLMVPASFAEQGRELLEEARAEAEAEGFDPE